MDTWSEVGHDLNLNKKRQKGKKDPIFSWFCLRVREEGKKRVKSFLPRSTEFRWSKFVGPKMKVHCIDEGYAYVPKMRDFVEDSREEFGKSKVSCLRSVHETS